MRARRHPIVRDLHIDFVAHGHAHLTRRRVRQGARDVRRTRLRPPARLSSSRSRSTTSCRLTTARKCSQTLASSLTGPLTTPAARRLGHAPARRPHRPRRWLRASWLRASWLRASWQAALHCKPHCGLDLDLTAHYFFDSAILFSSGCRYSTNNNQQRLQLHTQPHTHDDDDDDDLNINPMINPPTPCQ